jgi:hypothetical protein
MGASNAMHFGTLYAVSPNGFALFFSPRGADAALTVTQAT